MCRHTRQPVYVCQLGVGGGFVYIGGGWGGVYIGGYTCTLYVGGPPPSNPCWRTLI